MQTLPADMLYTIYDFFVEYGALQDLACSSGTLKQSVENYWSSRVAQDFGIEGVLKDAEALHKFLDRRNYKRHQEVSLLEFTTEHADTERYAEILSAIGIASNRALKNACFRGQTTVVANLLKSGKVNPAIGGNFCIQHASHGGYETIVKLLLEDPRVDPSADQNFAIVYAATLGRTGVVKLLLASKKVNCRDRNGMALKKAKERGHREIVDILTNC